MLSFKNQRWEKKTHRLQIIYVNSGTISNLTWAQSFELRGEGDLVEETWCSEFRCATVIGLFLNSVVIEPDRNLDGCFAVLLCQSSLASLLLSSWYIRWSGSTLSASFFVLSLKAINQLLKYFFFYLLYKVFYECRYKY